MDYYLYMYFFFYLQHKIFYKNKVSKKKIIIIINHCIKCLKLRRDLMKGIRIKINIVRTHNQHIFLRAIHFEVFMHHNNFVNNIC